MVIFIFNHIKYFIYHIANFSITWREGVAEQIEQSKIDVVNTILKHKREDIEAFIEFCIKRFCQN